MSEGGDESTLDTRFKRIKVSNMPSQFGKIAFFDLCSKFGRVKEVEISRKDGHSYGFCSYKTFDDAAYANYSLNDYTLRGNHLTSDPAPLTQKQIDDKIREEAELRARRELSRYEKRSNKPKKTAMSLRHLTPINPTFENSNGNFVPIGRSVPAPRNQRGRNNNNRRNNQNKGNQNRNNQNKGNQNRGNQKNRNNQNKGNQNRNNQNKGNQNKGNQNRNNQNKRNQNKGNQNRNNQNKGNQNKGNQNKGNQNKNNQNKGNQNRGNKNQSKYRLRKVQQTEPVTDAPSMNYYEVIVRDRATQEVVLEVLRREDELDKPIILSQEISF